MINFLRKVCCKSQRTSSTKISQSLTGFLYHAIPTLFIYQHNSINPSSRHCREECLVLSNSDKYRKILFFLAILAWHMDGISKSTKCVAGHVAGVNGCSIISICSYHVNHIQCWRKAEQAGRQKYTGTAVKIQPAAVLSDEKWLLMSEWQSDEFFSALVNTSKVQPRDYTAYLLRPSQGWSELCLSFAPSCIYALFNTYNTNTYHV